MAVTSLMTTPNPALQPLLDSLQPNALPVEPSVWPLALGYWLVLVAALLVIGLGVWLIQTQRAKIPLRNELKRLKQLPSSLEQLTQVHALLRWLLIHRQGAPKNLSSAELENRVSLVLDGQTVTWLNGHYQEKPVTIDWQQVDLLVATWQKAIRL